MFILASIVLLEIAVSIYILVMDEEEILLKVWEKMDDVSRDLVHSQLKCCGFNSTSEYEEIPPSCTDTDTGQQYNISCYTRLWDLIDDNLIASIASVATVFLVQIVAIVLAYKFKNNRVAQIKGTRTAWDL
ncbi:uncharacterized protein LOC117104144 [Anneissia japonica]|uniref:uncharacterized protein LOC117104144 n=1 Tax=Anneissia japonica TaxID=1529436 RepID=UPI00142575F0|nr:uncharacterized protein LOC117104144 [Anneissia japonica]